MYILTNQGLGQSETSCEPAQVDIAQLADYLTWLSNELRKNPPNPKKTALLKRLVELEVGAIILSFRSYIEAGCCEPALKDLELQANKLPWPTEKDLQKQRGKLIDAIQKAQGKAQKDFKHC
jgi:hypothetical protein